MKLDNVEAVKAIVREVVQATRLHELKDSEISTIFYGVCSFASEVAVPPAMQLLGELRSRDSLSHLSEQHIIQIALGVGNLGVEGIPAFLEVAREAIRDERLPKYRPFELAHLCFGIGKLRIVDEDIVTPLAAEILKSSRIPTLSQNELSVISRSLSRANYKNDDLFNTISKEMMRRFFDDLPENDSSVASSLGE